MSFDLYLYKHKSSKIREQDVATYLNNCSPFINNNEYPHQWHYSNAETGVYFIIEQSKEDTEDTEAFDNFVPLNFSCFINYLRPTYFGLEIFPLINKLIADLDIYILNPQDSEVNMPHRFDENYLENQWIKENDKFSLDLYKEYNLEYFPLDRSNYAWKYMYQRQYLQESLIEDIFVCGIFFIKNKSDNTIYTCVSWPESIPIILPPVDYIIIKKKYRKLFRLVEESGLVPYESIMDKFGKYFKPFEHEIPNLRILNNNDAAKITKEFNKIKIWKTIEEFGTGVSKDRFVNIKPG